MSGRGRGNRGGRGRMGGPNAAGPGGSCYCPSCGTSVAHQVGVPCFQRKCPNCGSIMARR